MNNSKNLILVGVLIVIGLGIYLLGSSGADMGDSVKAEPIVPRGSSLKKSGQYEIAKEITTPDGYINTSGVTIGEFVGKKVVLVDFWTYSCINCQRTTPYLNAWWEKYKDKGLVIIGVHTPEFEFEKKYSNVVAAAEKLGIKFPIVLDNDFSTWKAYRNQYWPRKYLIDIDGYVVYDHIGEGGYEETEKKIQELLGERAEISKPVAESVDMGKRLSPETYFGKLRNGGKTSYLSPSSAWQITDEYAQTTAQGAMITFDYEARKVFFVAGADFPVVAKVFKDDVLINTITIDGEQLYTLINDETYGKHRLKIIFDKPGVRAFTFTFG